MKKHHTARPIEDRAKRTLRLFHCRRPESVLSIAHIATLARTTLFSNCRFEDMSAVDCDDDVDDAYRCTYAWNFGQHKMSVLKSNDAARDAMGISFVTEASRGETLRRTSNHGTDIICVPSTVDQFITRKRHSFFFFFKFGFACARLRHVASRQMAFLMLSGTDTNEGPPKSKTQ